MPPLASNRPFTPEQSVEGPMQFEAIIGRLIGRVFTHTVVRVEGVEAGGTGPVGFVNVVNLLQQLDADNQGIPNQIIYKLPYFRLQGGGNAIIIDPKIGDIGLASFAMRDISEVKRSKSEGPPPSRREYDGSDGLYIGGFLNGAPSQYIHFLESGINIKSTGEIIMDCTKLKVNAPVETSSTIKADGDITDNASTQPQSMNSMRSTYNEHTHLGNGAGNNTNKPNEQM